MAKIGYLLLCEDVYKEKELIIKKPYNTIAPISIPGNFSFVMVFSVIELEEKEDYSVEIKGQDPNGKNIIEPQNIDFSLPSDERFKDRPIGSASFNLTYTNTVFEVEGTYTFTVTVNGKNSKTAEIPVHPAGKYR
ncbi:hypothetical protein SFC65_04490 [Priestia filamentosa]|uniref:DUF6941 family protein n=1 Tax=Priestia filamentosa TaxID=1402861 RepID=UPI0039825D3E